MCILFVMTLNIRCIWEKRSDVRKVSSVMSLIFVVEGRQGLRRAPSRCMGQSGHVHPYYCFMCGIPPEEL